MACSLTSNRQNFEHAIARCEIPDQLPIWYNYICWYESVSGQDPEQGYRETLERCLRVYESNDTYNNDERVVQLWLKYIKMQTEQMRFFEVLFHRQLGRHSAAFYLSWSAVYEQQQRLAEAESVCQLGLDNGALPESVLINNFNRIRQLRVMQQQQQHQQQQNFQQPQHYVHLPLNYAPPQRQVQPYQAQVFQQQQQQVAYVPASQPLYQPNVVIVSQAQQQPPPNVAVVSQAQQQSTPPNADNTVSQAQQNIVITSAPTTNVTQVETTTNTTQRKTTETEALKAATHVVVQSPPLLGIRAGIKLPAHTRNAHVVWKVPLKLDEPPDANRRCHYAKHMVYPDGKNVEYSPEELRARKYKLPKHDVALAGKTNGHQNAEPAQADEDVDTDDYEEDIEGEEEDNESYYSDEFEPSSDDEEDNQPIASFKTALKTDEPGVLKMTFKKTGNDSASSYKIEPATPTGIGRTKRPKNGYGFHPYSIPAHTSTPKVNHSNNNNNKRNGNDTNGRHQQQKPNHFSQFSSSNSISSPDNNTSAAANHSNGDESSVYTTAIQNASYNDNANFSFSSAVAYDNSNCSLSSAVGRLDFRDTSLKHNFNHNNNNISTTTALDISTYQENSYFATRHDEEAKSRRLDKANETIVRHLAKEALDPFNSELCRAFLAKLDYPKPHDVQGNLRIIQTPLPKLCNSRTLQMSEHINFSIDKEIGRGSYGSVYKATDNTTGEVVALKFQKPPNTWEIYICDQVLKRIVAPSILPGLMDISKAVIAPNACLIATAYAPYGSLLDINNKIRQATTKVMHESLVMHFSAQICSIVSHLHKQQIIHADIKPDNFLLMRVPSIDAEEPSLRLIDFGCAIDMSLYPDPATRKFRKIIQTDGFTCIEMQEGRPWSYETDLFCIAGTIHVMLFGEYMQTQKRAGSWEIRQKLPRYLKKHVWSQFFNDMLNIKASQLPSLDEMCQLFLNETYRMESELSNQIRSLSNILRRR